MRDEVQEEENVWKVISIVEPMWLQPVKEIVATSDFFQAVATKIESGVKSSQHYHYMKGVWFCKGHILLDPASPLCTIFF